MLGQEQAYNQLPWFWSDQHGVNIQMIGIPEIWDEVAIRGDREQDDFMIFYLNGARLVGAMALNNARDIRVAKRLMQSGREVSAYTLEDPSVKLQTLLK